MPLYKVDYTNTHFSKIVCKDLNIKECYVGHTTNFKTRKQNHKKDCNNQNGKCFNLYVYQFIRENGGWENWDMILINTLKCENRLDALKKEREYIETNYSMLNMQKRPNVSNEERQEKNQEWRENNREKLNRQLNEINKRLRVKHPERFKEYDRKKWETHKDKIQAKQKEIIECECGINHQRVTRARHLKSQHHQNFILNNNIDNVSQEEKQQTETPTSSHII